MEAQALVIEEIDAGVVFYEFAEITDDLICFFL